MEFAANFVIIRLMQLVIAASALPAKWLEEENVADYWSADKKSQPDVGLGDFFEDYEPGILPPTAGQRVRRVIRRLFG